MPILPLQRLRVASGDSIFKALNISGRIFTSCHISLLKFLVNRGRLWRLPTLERFFSQFFLLRGCLSQDLFSIPLEDFLSLGTSLKRFLLFRPGPFRRVLISFNKFLLVGQIVQPLLGTEFTVDTSPEWDEHDLDNTSLHEQVSSFLHYSSLFKEKIPCICYKSEDTVLVINIILVMDSHIFMKSETKPCLNLVPFWRKATLTLISCDSFLLSVALSCPHWKITFLLVLQALLKTKNTRKCIWNPLLMRLWKPGGPLRN